MIDSIGWNFITQEKGVKYFWPKQGVNMVNKEKEEAAGFQQTRQRELFKELDEILNRLDEIEKKQADRFPHLVERLDALEKKVKIGNWRKNNGYI